MSKQPDFNKLRDFWYKKLKDDGFIDIENNEQLSNNDKFRSKKFLASYKEKAEYYYMSNHFLSTYEFENSIDRIIWEYHTEGVSVRNIAKILKKLGYKKKGRGKVWQIVKRLRSIMNRLYLSI